MDAAYILKKAIEHKSVAVFVIVGRVRAMAEDSHRFKMLMLDYPRDCMGIYRPGCSKEWISEDLRYMHARVHP